MSTEKPQSLYLMVSGLSILLDIDTDTGVFQKVFVLTQSSCHNHKISSLSLSVFSSISSWCFQSKFHLLGIVCMMNREERNTELQKILNIDFTIELFYAQHIEHFRQDRHPLLALDVKYHNDHHYNFQYSLPFVSVSKKF